jgi:cation diffusion facilitator family transporter
MEENRFLELKAAEKGAIVGIVAYILLSCLKLVVGTLLHSASLLADGLNNFTDIAGSVTIFIGLRLSRKPKDQDHAFGHWKFETIASMLTSFIMFSVGLDVLLKGIDKIRFHEFQKPDPLAATVGVFSAIVMIAVYFYISRLALKVKSNSLKAAAKDNLSDAATSIGTSLSILFTLLPNFYFLDVLTAIVIGGIIIFTAIQIFKESAFHLSDGFDENLVEKYKKSILSIREVKHVKSIRGRMYGENIYLDVVIEMDPSLTVLQSHYITEIIEKKLSLEYQVFDTDIHIEPYMYPDHFPEASQIK